MSGCGAFLYAMFVGTYPFDQDHKNFEMTSQVCCQPFNLAIPQVVLLGKTTKYWTHIAQIIRCLVFNSTSSCSLPPYEQVLSRCRWSGGAIPSKLCSKLQLEPESLLQRKYVVCAKKIQLAVRFYFWCSFLLKVKTVSQICFLPESIAWTLDMSKLNSVHGERGEKTIQILVCQPVQVLSGASGSASGKHQTITIIFWAVHRKVISLYVVLFLIKWNCSCLKSCIKTH